MPLLNDRDVARINDAVLRDEYAPRGGSPERALPRSPTPSRVTASINTSGERIPDNSIALVDDAASGESDIVYNLLKPNADNIDSSKLVIVTKSIPEDGRGHCFPPLDLDKRVKVSLDASSSPGDECGTQSGSWVLKKGNTGLKVVCEDGGLARVRPFSGGSALTFFTIFNSLTVVALPNGTYDVDDSPFTGSWVLLDNEVDLAAELGGTPQGFMLNGYVGTAGSVIQQEKFAVGVFVQLREKTTNKDFTMWWDTTFFNNSSAPGFVMTGERVSARPNTGSNQVGACFRMVEDFTGAATFTTDFNRVFDAMRAYVYLNGVPGTSDSEIVVSGSGQNLGMFNVDQIAIF